jgi:hypothetical protein
VRVYRALKRMPNRFGRHQLSGESLALFWGGGASVVLLVVFTLASAPTDVGFWFRVVGGVAVGVVFFGALGVALWQGTQEQRRIRRVRQR